MKPMKIRFALLALALSTSTFAQSAKDAEKALRQSLEKKQFFLRGYSAETSMQWKWDGSKLVETDPKFLALSAVTVKTVKLNGTHLMLQGDRQILVSTGGRNAQLSAESVPVTIDVDLGSGDAAKVLPEVSGAIFYPEMNSAIRDLPNAVVGLVPTPPSTQTVTTECDCTHASACSDYIPYLAMKGVKAPAVQLPARPPMNAVSVTVVPSVDEAGKVQSVWLGRPLDPASDAVALQIAKSYVYTPAACHNDPVSAAFRLEVQVEAPAKGGKGKK